MPTPSTTDFLAATSDPDLIARIQAAAQLAGVPNAAQWALAHLDALCLHDDAAIISAYAYAAAVRREHIDATPAPAGSNPGAVTDAMLTAAVEALRPAP